MLTAGERSDLKCVLRSSVFKIWRRRRHLEQIKCSDRCEMNLSPGEDLPITCLRMAVSQKQAADSSLISARVDAQLYIAIHLNNCSNHVAPSTSK